jgi:alanyl-tRNA synthetase
MSQPKALSGAQLRRVFADFFRERGHEIVPSASLIPEGDPTLLFVNAGMVPFKRMFLGEEQRAYTRAASVQKCLRVSGKHNDLENVGRTPHHHTFFEMLGNFSFGDYDKRTAIEYAWELFTGVIQFDPSQLVVTVLRSDDEAYDIWRREIGLPERALFRLGESENFWTMGATGPCGPCSEIYIICPSECTRPDCDPACDCGRYKELWNLVFMQDELAEDGTRTPLPRRCIDTGMGVDRLARVLQGVPSTFETDLLAPLLNRAGEIAGVRYGAGEESDVSLRVIADHVRACTFLVADGVRPSSEGRGYVLRRILRRAARHGVLVGVEEPFLYEIASLVADKMGDDYPELRQQLPAIQETIRREEARFLVTLVRGLQTLDAEIESARTSRSRRLPGSVVFTLYDTYGFPPDLTEDVLRGRDMDYDREGFDAAMAEQRQRGRAAWKGSGEQSTSAGYLALVERGVRSEFVGYDALEAQSTVAALLRDGEEIDTAEAGDTVEIVAPKTPFYPEGGGQVGDVGEISGEGVKIEVTGTHRPAPELIVHSGRVLEGTVRAGAKVVLSVPAPTRAATMRNHSATHLLHWSLRQVLGSHVSQAGSLVAPDRLRFDFSHEGALSAEQIQQIEDHVNRLVLEDHPRDTAEMTYREAVESGAVAIFEEKYGERVRVVRMGPSVELCGGTHVTRTSQIGPFRIVAQSALGAGTRRVEAATGHRTLEQMRSDQAMLRQLAEQLGTTLRDLPARIAALVARERALEKELTEARRELLAGTRRDLTAGCRKIGGVSCVAAEVEGVDARRLRELVDETKAKLGSGVVLLASRTAEKAALALGVTKDLEGRFSARELMGELARVIGGSGGGRPDFAQGGGPDPSKLPEALARLPELIEARANT